MAGLRDHGYGLHTNRAHCTNVWLAIYKKGRQSPGLGPCRSQGRRGQRSLKRGRAWLASLRGQDSSSPEPLPICLLHTTPTLSPTSEGPLGKVWKTLPIPFLPPGLRLSSRPTDPGQRNPCEVITSVFIRVELLLDSLGWLPALPPTSWVALEYLLNLLSPEYHLTTAVNLNKRCELTQLSAQHIEGTQTFLESK